MSSLTGNLGLVKHASGYEGWADDMNANLDEIDNVLADISKSNIFINPMLRFWQRGTSLTGVSGDKYLADRWINYLGSTRCIVSRQEFTPGQTDVPCEPQYYHRLFSPAGYLTQSSQRIEDVRTCAGQKTVLSFYARADKPQTAGIWVAQDFGSGGSTWVLVDNTSYNLTTSWQRYVFPVDIPSISGKTIGTSSNLMVGFNRLIAPEDMNIDFALPQFNLGSVPLPFKPRPIGQELALCQRYYQTENMLCRTLGDGTTHYECEWIPFKDTMRAVPTCVVTGDISDGDSFTLWNSLVPMTYGIFVSKLIQSTDRFIDVSSFTADAELY